ncbi:hypothetical protein HY642_02650 [Candidatus Woesearchaeota archaeon]|nr:hypothetical protein [Candidatus Woesearchaeota archaeon]
MVVRVMVNGRKLLVALTFLAVLSAFATAQLTDFADPLNYFNERNHTVYITWSGTNFANITLFTPSNWTIIQGPPNCTTSAITVLAGNSNSLNATLNTSIIIRGVALNILTNLSNLTGVLNCTGAAFDPASCELVSNLTNQTQDLNITVNHLINNITYTQSTLLNTTITVPITLGWLINLSNSISLLQNLTVYVNASLAALRNDTFNITGNVNTFIAYIQANMTAALCNTSIVENSSCFYLNITNSTLYVINKSVANITLSIPLINTTALSNISVVYNLSNQIPCTNINNTIAIVLQSNSSFQELALSPLVINGTNGTAFNASPLVRFIRIEDGRIFNTLVEYGRGRGNYFFSSFGGTATSGKMYTGCTLLPNGTGFELNYLHKVYNIQQYFGYITGVAVNASFGCAYNYSRISRVHSSDAIGLTGNMWFSNYSIAEIRSSWERMGFISVQYLADQLLTGARITTNCTNMTYALSQAGGSVVVDADNFTFEIRNKDPFIVNATTTTTLVGNGTQEVLITYNITNTESYDVTGVSIDIEAPTNAMFIGTRGELWGVGLDQYHLEKNEIQAGSSEIISLFARFDTTSATPVSNFSLGRLVRVQFIPCWEQFAYNPTRSLQRVPVSNVVPVDLSTNTSILCIPCVISVINVTIKDIKEIVTYINSTQFSNVTTSMIFDRVSNLTLGIDTQLTNITTQILGLRDFDEELVFLVTDSFNSQQAARDELQKGNLATGITEMQQSQNKLTQAVDRLATLQKREEEAAKVSWIRVGLDGAEKFARNYTYVLLLLIGIALIALNSRRKARR